MKKFIVLSVFVSLISFNAFANVVVDIPELSEFEENSVLHRVAFPGVFRMFNEPLHTVRPSCDTTTILKLDNGQVLGKIAVLEEKVIGLCDLYLFPNARHYELTTIDGGCGSVVYEGSRITEEGIVKFELIDHRNRLCRDLQPAQIVVRETLADGQEITLYSL